MFVSLFNIVSISLHTFCPAFYKLENSLMIEVRSSCPKTLTHCFPNILQCLEAVTSKLLLHRTEKMIVGGCQIGTVGRMWKNFPSKCPDILHSGTSNMRMRFQGVCCAMHDGASQVSGYSGQHLWFVQVQEIQPEGNLAHPRRHCP